jgi:murein DD-endopeptidase MepM/ murein hydrolase activator NlpD
MEIAGAGEKLTFCGIQKVIAVLFSIVVVAGVISFFGIRFFVKADSGAMPVGGKKTVETVDNSLGVTFNDFLDPLIADGFDFPVGNVDGQGSYTSKLNGKTYNGWYVAAKFGELYSLGIHPGEDWNGKGGGNTDQGQPVHSIAKGKVIDAKDYGSPWGGIVVIEHRYLENGKLLTVLSLYAHLEKIMVKKGETVNRRKQIGTIGTGGGSYPAHLHFEIRKESMKGYGSTFWPSSNGKDLAWVKKHYEHPTDFIKNRRKLLAPMKEKSILIAIKHQYKMVLIKNGKITKQYPIALSQSPLGHKVKQGDNRLPEGEYRIIQKARGPFSGVAAAEYLGVAWMRINYPNNQDAQDGHRKGLISLKQKESIIKANNSGKEPIKNTKLGGGIGIHGWIDDWNSSKKLNLTWGCISMRNTDILDLYPLIELQTPIIIYP